MFEPYGKKKKGCVLFEGTKSDLQCLWTCLALKWTIIPETSKVVRKTNACDMIAVFCCSRRRCRYEEPREFDTKLTLGSSLDKRASETSFFTDAIPRISCQRTWPTRRESGGKWDKDCPVMEISRIKIRKMTRILFVSQRCRAPFWNCTRDVKGGGGTSLISDSCTEECLAHLELLKSDASPTGRIFGQYL